MRQPLLLLLLIAVACKSPETKAGKARDELKSWAATGQELSSGFARGTLQTPYVKSTAKVAADEVDKLKQDLETDKDSSRTRDEVASLYRQLSNAIEQKDRGPAQQLALDFAQAASRVRTSS